MARIVLGGCARKIGEETGLATVQDELTDLTALALALPDTAQSSGKRLRSAVYPSHAGCDEGEEITPRLVLLEGLWRETCRDARALAGCALYTGLRREGSWGFKRWSARVKPEMCRLATP
ncbi:MAG: hypothetical protein M1832_001438 [Thelocarpon impressellum]|nr:MAG: hypothetical protein M1832_001438 [Thelocarpon impressellum]